MGKTLTPELIQLKCKTDKLANIKNLNLWGNELDDISLIKEMPNIEICSLSLNKIYLLKDFASCKKLTELYLRKNQVSDLFEIKYLTHCPGLKVLWLWDNPIADHKFYRPYIIKLLPNLIKLDNNAVTPEERVEAQKMNISEQDIASNYPPKKQEKEDESSFHHPERPRSEITGAHSKGKEGMGLVQKRGQSPHIQSSSQNNFGNLGQNQSNPPQNQPLGSAGQNGSNYRNENILCAVLALLKELDESGLELVKRDIERKISQKKQGQ